MHKLNCSPFWGLYFVDTTLAEFGCIWVVIKMFVIKLRLSNLGSKIGLLLFFIWWYKIFNKMYIMSINLTLTSKVGLHYSHCWMRLLINVWGSLLESVPILLVTAFLGSGIQAWVFRPDFHNDMPNFCWLTCMHTYIVTRIPKLVPIDSQL